MPNSKSRSKIKQRRKQTQSKTKRKRKSKQKAGAKKVYRHGCPEGYFLKRGYTRRSYTRKAKTGKVAKVKGTKVSPKCTKGKGTHGKKVIPPLKHGLLSKYGYHVNKSEKERRAALEEAIKHGSKSEIIKHLRALVTLQRWNPKSHDVMLKDYLYLRKKYYPERAQIYQVKKY